MICQIFVIISVRSKCISIGIEERDQMKCKSVSKMPEVTHCRTACEAYGGNCHRRQTCLTSSLFKTNMQQLFQRNVLKLKARHHGTNMVVNPGVRAKASSSACKCSSSLPSARGCGSRLHLAPSGGCSILTSRPHVTAVASQTPHWSTTTTRLTIAQLKPRSAQDLILI
jgi:hypothetical protein